MSRSRLLLIALLMLVPLAACGEKEEPEATGQEPAATQAADACAKDQLELEKAGTLTIANGKRFESAVAYAIAEKLGFTKSEVEWTVVPFNSSYAPGPKDFDFDVNQISISPKRAEAVDFSSPYYVAEQAVVAGKDSDAADATSLADLA